MNGGYIDSTESVYAEIRAMPAITRIGVTMWPKIQLGIFIWPRVGDY